MKKLLLALCLILSPLSIFADESSDVVNFVKDQLPSKVRSVIRKGLSRNIVRSRLGRPVKKSDSSDEYQIQSSANNLIIKYSSDKKLDGLSFEFIGAADRVSRLNHEEALEKLKALKAISTVSGSQREIRLPTLGFVATFDSVSGKMLKIEFRGLK